MLALTFAIWSHAQPAAAGLFGSSNPPMRKATELLRRQEAPKVDKSVEALIDSDNARVVISISAQRLQLLAGDQVYIDSPVSTGKRAGMTPTGSFKILEKDLDHRSNIYGSFCDSRNRVVREGVSLKVDSAPSGTHYVGAPMRFFCRLTDGGIGMHIGVLPGYPASHGCVRLPAEIAPLIYQKVKVGTSVVILP
ncbi:MAG: hypothetical protein JWL59_4913 [Chthoniobacteraceae bacterium]|nr:hypothetical protein [Chthoniobacteraceae bacterium]